jgi:glycine/D-amino acid oxidase-like deaminating enzyme
MAEVAKVAPSMANAPVAVEQACYLPVSGDGLPVIGSLPSARNAYVACGLSCWGILNGPASGKAVAEMIYVSFRFLHDMFADSTMEDLSQICPML